MKRDQFKRLKEGRLDRIRRHMFDASLTPKQRTELRKIVRRRERLGNEHAANAHLRPRVNASIRHAVTPLAMKVTASRYRNAMTPNQRQNVRNAMRALVEREERKHMTSFRTTKDHKNLLKALRDLKTTVRNTKAYMSRSPLKPRK